MEFVKYMWIMDRTDQHRSMIPNNVDDVWISQTYCIQNLDGAKKIS